MPGSYRPRNGRPQRLPPPKRADHYFGKGLERIRFARRRAAFDAWMAMSPAERRALRLSSRPAQAGSS